MTVSGTLKLRAWGFLLAALGGFLIGLGPLLVWGHMTVMNQIPQDVYGTDHIIGKVVLALGLIVVIGSFLLRFRSTRRGQIATAIVVVVAAIVALGLAVYVALDPVKVLFEVSDSVATVLGDSLETTLKPGIFLPMAGSLLAVIGSILSLKWAKRRDAELETEAAMGSPSSEEPAPRDP